MSKCVRFIVTLSVGVMLGGVSTYSFCFSQSQEQLPVAVQIETRDSRSTIPIAAVPTSIMQLPAEVIAALTAVEADDPGTAAKDRDKRVELVKFWLHECRRNGCLPERVPLIKAYMARFTISWEEIGSSPQEVRDMWFQRSFELLSGARGGSRWHLRAFRDYLAAAPDYVTLASLGTSQAELDKLEQDFVTHYGS